MQVDVIINASGGKDIRAVSDTALGSMHAVFNKEDGCYRRSIQMDNYGNILFNKQFEQGSVTMASRVRRKGDHLVVSYLSANNHSCTDKMVSRMHVTALLHLENELPKHDLKIELWRSEPGGEWHETLDGLLSEGVLEFLGDDDAAQDWFIAASNHAEWEH